MCCVIAENFENSCIEYKISSNFQNGILEIITITVTKMALIQVFFLPYF